MAQLDIVLAAVLVIGARMVLMERVEVRVEHLLMVGLAQPPHHTHRHPQPIIIQYHRQHRRLLHHQLMIHIHIRHIVMITQIVLRHRHHFVILIMAQLDIVPAVIIAIIARMV